MNHSIESMRVDGDSLDAQQLTALWNETHGDDLALTARAVTWCCTPTARYVTRAFVARRGGSTASAVDGFVVAGNIDGIRTGWVDALAVRPGAHRSRLRAALLAHAEAWLTGSGCEHIALGSGPRSLVRGGPTHALQSRSLQRLGFQPSGLEDVWDMAVDVARYEPPATLEHDIGVVRIAAPADREEILARLAGRSDLFCAQAGVVAGAAEIESLREAAATDARVSDLMLLWTERGLEGLCQVLFADSATPIEIAYPYRLPRQWSSIRTIATAPALGDAAATLLLHAALRRLHNLGVNSCVALGVAATRHFADLGFKPYRRWRPMIKPVAR